MNEIIYSDAQEIELESNKIYVQLSSVTSGRKPVEHLKLLFDTGAFITLIDRTTANLNHYPIFHEKGCKISGFSENGLSCDLRKVPSVLFGGYVLHDVVIATPHYDIDVIPVLGMNILENFSFGIDFGSRLLYLSKRNGVVSQKPRYRCGTISTIEQAANHTHDYSGSIYNDYGSSVISEVFTKQK